MSGEAKTYSFIDFALYILHAPEPQPHGKLVDNWMAAIDKDEDIVTRAQRVKRFAKNEGFNFETQECIEAINFWDEWSKLPAGGPVVY